MLGLFSLVLSSALASNTSAPASPADSPAGVSKISIADSPVAKLLEVPGSFSFDETSSKQSKFDTGKWMREIDGEGSEVFTEKEKKDSRLVFTRNTDGSLESVSIFKTNKSSDKKAKYAEEASGAALFSEKGQPLSLTRCEDNSLTADAGGRVCITATPNLCKALKTGDPIDEKITSEVNKKEMHALTMILTLRGADHQLDNVIRSGNRLGLKTGLQTTIGLLLTLAKVRGPDSDTTKKMPAPVLALVNHGLPRLKEACGAIGIR